MHRRKEGDRVHFLLISYWDSQDSITAFAGPDIETARYYPRDREYLLELEPGVQHYELVEIGIIRLQDCACAWHFKSAQGGIGIAVPTHH